MNKLLIYRLTGYYYYDIIIYRNEVFYLINIKKLRKEKGLSQMKLAAETGVSLTTIRNWEYGTSEPNEENREKLKKVLDLK